MSEHALSQERTEAATPARLRRARADGDVARSSEVGSVAVLAAGILAFLGFGPGLLRTAFDVFRAYLAGFTSVEVAPGTVAPLASHLATSLASMVLPLGAVVVVAGAGAGIAQSGVGFTARPVVPTLRRLAPGAGLRRLLSRRGGFELGKSVVKLALVGGAVAWAVRGALEELLPLAGSGLGAAVRTIPEAMLQVAAAGTLALGAVATLDLLFQRRDREHRLAMTRQQLREERRRSEGDPLVRTRIRTRQQELRGRRMIRDTRRADVVVADDTRIALALQYEPGRMRAPRLVARGRRLQARRIREIASEASIPIVESPGLARELDKRCELGAEIPRALYETVAELLADVYRARVAAGDA